MGLSESKTMESSQSGLCRRRNSPRNSGVKVSTPLAKARESAGKTAPVTAPSKVPEKPSQKLPVLSWRDLLEDQPLNPNAKAFVPKGAEFKPPPGLTAPVVDMGTAPDEPEWMQYLSKKAAGLHAPASCDKISLDPPAQLRPSCEQEGGVLFQTSEYLKILKDVQKSKMPGPKPKKKLGPSNTSSPTSSLVQAANVEFPGSVPIGPVQWTAAWRAHVTRASITVGLPESEGDDADSSQTLQYAQDDTFLEKLLVDEDLSDPAYLSEVESSSFRGPSEKNASFHSLGRRPRRADKKIRSYVMQDLSHRLDGLIATTLLRLQRFSDEQKSCLGASAPRRFIIGLREVARRMKQGKLACIIVAPDIEEDQDNGGLDDRMRELLASAYSSGLPVIFALSRARIGCALGKTVHVSVFAIMDATGAQGLLDESLTLAQQLRQSWLSRLEMKKPVQKSIVAASPWRRPGAVNAAPCAGRAA